MDPHERFFRSLSPEEEQLLVIRDFLYEGNWNELVTDLEARREGKPFVFKLNSRIEEDLQRIEKLESYESSHGVNLGEYLARKEQDRPSESLDDEESSVREAVELDRSGESGATSS